MSNIVKLFGYGSLTDKRIQNILFKRNLKMIPAKLHNWITYVCSEGYLGITRNKNTYVMGYLIELTKEEIKICDLWEEIPIYEKEFLEIEIVEDDLFRKVYAYTRQLNSQLSEFKKYKLLESDYLIQEANLFMKKLMI
ncbi:MAG: gamma-glutamylcyclotransferase family protein [Clostridiales bacterium]